MILLLYILSILAALLLVALSIPVHFRILWINKKLSISTSYIRFNYQSQLTNKSDTKEASTDTDTHENATEKATETSLQEKINHSTKKKAKRTTKVKQKKFDGLKLFSCGKEITAFLGWVVRSIRRIFAIPVWQPVEGFIQIGGEDPALIGMLYGYGCSVQPLLPSMLTLRIYPDFEHGEWEYSVSGRCTIRPIRVVWVVIRILLDFPLLSGIRLYRKTRIRNK